MRIQLILTMAAVMANAILTPPSTAEVQGLTQERLIDELNSARQDVRQGAISYILRQVPPEERDAALERALTDELNRLNQVIISRREADRAGKLVEDFPAEYYADVINAVSQSSNPIGIRALAGALGTGRMAEEGLAKFGEQVLPTVIAVGCSKVGPVTAGTHGDTPPHVVASSLAVLRRIVEEPQASLSPQSRGQIVAVARERLMGPQDSGVIVAACKLAVATRDPGLRQRVQQLVNDRRELNVMGVSDPKVAEFVEQMARNALDGR